MRATIEPSELKPIILEDAEIDFHSRYLPRRKLPPMWLKDRQMKPLRVLRKAGLDVDIAVEEADCPLRAGARG